MVEIVVILGILVFISAILLSTFPGFNEGAALIRGEQELALNLRRAQDIALAVAEVRLANGTRETPKRVGLYFNLAAPASYFLFVDEDGDNIYNPSVDNVIESPVTFQRGIALSRLLDENGNPVPGGVVNIVFSSPEANMTLTNNVGLIGTRVQIELRSPNLGLTKKVTVITSGQIAVE